VTRTVRLTIVLVVFGLVAAACSDTSGLEAELADAEARVAELEAELFVATSTSLPATVTIEGAMTLAIDDSFVAGDSCSGAGGFDDISAGADVVVIDGSGNTVGTSSLESGEVTDVKIIAGDDRNRFVVREFCIFPFSVGDVASEAAFYTVEVANREGPTYSNADMVAQEWKVALSLG